MNEIISKEYYYLEYYKVTYIKDQQSKVKLKEEKTYQEAISKKKSALKSFSIRMKSFVNNDEMDCRNWQPMKHQDTTANTRTALNRTLNQLTNQ